MQRQQRESLVDILIVWGFVLTLVGLMGAGIYEACKIVAVIPAAFQAAPSLGRNPLWASDEDARPNQTGRGRSTPHERALERQRAEQDGR